MGACRALFAWPLRPGAFALSAEKRRQRWAGESREGGEEGGKKKNPTGDSGGWAGPAGQGASRAGWWQSWAKFGKAPPGVGGHAPVACTPGEPAGGGAAPLLPGNGFFPRNNAPPPPSSLPNFGTGIGGEMERGRGYRGAEPVQGDTRGHQGQLAPPKAKSVPLPALAFNMIALAFNMIFFFLFLLWKSTN